MTLFAYLATPLFVGGAGSARRSPGSWPPNGAAALVRRRRAAGPGAVPPGEHGGTDIPAAVRAAAALPAAVGGGSWCAAGSSAGGRSGAAAVSQRPLPPLRVVAAGAAGAGRAGTAATRPRPASGSDVPAGHAGRVLQHAHDPGAAHLLRRSQFLPAGAAAAAAAGADECRGRPGGGCHGRSRLVAWLGAAGHPGAAVGDRSRRLRRRDPPFGPRRGRHCGGIRPPPCCRCSAATRRRFPTDSR